MRSLILYGTLGCHLCEQAEELLVPLLQPLQCDLRKVDIADDDGLMERYGIRIPVLQRDDGAELGWPFDAEMAAAFLS